LHSPLLSLLRKVLEEISEEGVIKESTALKLLTNIPKERLRIEYGIIENQLREYIGIDPRLSGTDIFQYLFPVFVYETHRTNAYAKFLEESCESGKQNSDRGLEVSNGMEVSVWDHEAIGGDEILEVYVPLSATDIATRFVRFLNATDPAKIKKCHSCNSFYLSKQSRATQKYCSDMCKRAVRWTPEEWAAYMRQRREDKRLDMKRKVEEANEEEIKKTMEALGISRDEALELMKWDKKVDRGGT
jgi:hypothetical protein